MPVALPTSRISMLYVFSGLPGVGKSALSRALARERRAVHLRIDTIEQALRDSGGSAGGPEGYNVAYQIASDNLRLGLEVVADSVNPLRVTREAWRDVAERSGVPLVEIEVACSNRAEHRQRVESRTSDVPGLRLPSWQEVVQREYEAWDRPPLVLDTAGQSMERSFDMLLRALQIEGSSRAFPPPR